MIDGVIEGVGEGNYTLDSAITPSPTACVGEVGELLGVGEGVIAESPDPDPNPDPIQKITKRHSSYMYTYSVG